MKKGREGESTKASKIHQFSSRLVRNEPPLVSLFSSSMSGTPLNRSPPRDDFSLLGGGGGEGASDNADDADETIVGAIGGEVFNVVVPVAACIGITSALVQLLNPSGSNGSAGVSWASAAYKEKVKRELFLFL